MRTLAMPKAAEPWSLTSLRERLIKIGAKVTRHGRYVTFQRAEVAVPPANFREILVLIARLPDAGSGMTERSAQMRPTTTPEVRLDAGKAARFSASAEPTGGFDRAERYLPCC
jgi:hypothetical protein